MRAYLQHEVSLRDLKRFVWPALRALHHQADPDAAAIVSKAALWLAEFDRGHRTEAELRDLLRTLVPPLKVT